MSQYTRMAQDGRMLMWGYDYPLCEYFFAVYFNEEEMKTRDEDNDIYFNISSHTTLTPHPDKPKQMDYANSEILELMKPYHNEIPKEHRDAIAMDLPF